MRYETKTDWDDVIINTILVGVVIFITFIITMMVCVQRDYEKNGPKISPEIVLGKTADGKTIRMYKVTRGMTVDVVYSIDKTTTVITQEGKHTKTQIIEE